MAPYRIELMTENGEVLDRRVFECDDDDQAIDQAGEVAHPHSMHVWQEGRHVAHFPPWRSD